MILLFLPPANTSKTDTEVAFKPARVILQDFTGVPAVVDLAAMRDATKRLGADPAKINPHVPVDLVVDHSVQVRLLQEPGFCFSSSLALDAAFETWERAPQFWPLPLSLSGGVFMMTQRFLIHII